MGTMLKELRYSLYLTTHPFKGFWEIKHENRGSLRTAVFWLAAYTLLSVLSGFCTAYLFNQDGGVNFNVYKSVATTLALFSSGAFQTGALRAFMTVRVNLWI